ncbi:zinc ribbon domain-containing protein [Nonomuraea sp. NPDC059194]|uniref:zinc ribbon domain-containing protein n=1 Tax=Nonomuraea sp. NPDC059194 TaxID=3346764 RepID=UPI00367FBE61
MRRLAVPGVAVGLVLLSAPAASAHEHPSGITDLVTPAVVRVETKALIDITLLDHVGELLHIERSYELPLGVGTGTVVNPDGTLVTLTQVVNTDKDLGVYAANRVFADYHKADIPADFAKHKVDDETLNHHLELCYDLKSKMSTCIVDIKQDITIFPNITPADGRGFKAEVVKLGDSPDSPAVLRPTSRADGGIGLPTAPLAEKVPDKAGSPTSIAGFLGRPAPNQALKLEIGHLGQGGAGEGGRVFTDPQKKVDEPVKLGKLIDQGLRGAPVIGDKDGHVIGLLVGGGATAKMIGVREITSALAVAKTPARRGTVDGAFEAALQRFHTKNYTAAAPLFQRVLDLYPGQPVAAAHLKESLTKKGTAADIGARKAAPEPSTTIPLWPFIAGAALVLALAAGLALLLWRRRRRALEEEEQEELPPQEMQLATGPPDDGANPTMMVRRSQPFPVVPSQQPQHQPQQPVLTAQQQVKFCTSCGMKLGPAHRFCGYCGHPIET